MTTARIRLDYAPTPRQSFSLCGADECLYGGRAGGQKRA